MSAEEITIGVNEDENIIIIYYEKKDAKLIVRHVDANTNEAISEREVTGKVGDPYEIEEQLEDGYTLVEIIGNESGTLTEADTIVTYKYAINTNVVVRYKNKITGDLLEQETSITGYEGKSYNTERKAFEGYIYNSDTGNTSGRMDIHRQSVKTRCLLVITPLQAGVIRLKKIKPVAFTIW